MLVKLKLFGCKKHYQKLKSQILQLIIKKWPNSASYEEIEAAHSSDYSKTMIRKSVKSLKEGLFIVEKDSRYFPANDSLAMNYKLIRCEKCEKTYPVKKIFRVGMGSEDGVFLYCDKDSTLIAFSLDNPRIRNITIHRPLWEWTHEYEEIESHLISCPCGGEFRFRNPLRCPSCTDILSEPWPRGIYYFAIDRLIDGYSGSGNVWKD